MEHGRFVCRCAVDMFARTSGSLKDAWIAFNRFSKRDHMGSNKVEGMGEEA